MYRITAPRANPDRESRIPPANVRLLLGVLAVLAMGLLSYYVQVLQEQVVRGQRFRAQLQQSGTTFARATQPRGNGQLVASRR